MMTRMPNLFFPGDKSIAHRLVLVSLLLNKEISISNLPSGEDVLTSLSIVKKLGVKVEWLSEDSVLLRKEPLNDEFHEILDCRNSGTTARLLCGILANLNGHFKLVGDESLSKRPMERVVRPLADLMGIDIVSTDEHLPVFISGKGHSKAVRFYNVTGSAQVKSAVLFAGIAARGETIVIEDIPSRDHTERLIKFLKENSQKESFDFPVPGDISSAAYFVVLAVVTGVKICVKNVLLNPTRTGFLRILKRMGADIEERIIDSSWEPIGDIVVSGGNLVGTDILKEEIPSVIDELPVLSVAMAFGKGKSTVSGASELRVKESDRISCLISQLKKAGVDCEEKADGYSINGGNSIKPSILNSFKDHRLAMSFAILAKCAKQNISIENKDCVSISFPNFWNMLDNWYFE